MEKVDRVPDVRVADLLAPRFHHVEWLDAALDGLEDLGVAAAVFPFGIDQVGRLRAWRRLDAVTLGLQPMTVAADARVDGPARLDRVLRRRDRVLGRDRLQRDGVVFRRGGALGGRGFLLRLRRSGGRGEPTRQSGKSPATRRRSRRLVHSALWTSQRLSIRFSSWVFSLPQHADILISLRSRVVTSPA